MNVREILIFFKFFNRARTLFINKKKKHTVLPNTIKIHILFYLFKEVIYKKIMKLKLGKEKTYLSIGSR